MRHSRYTEASGLWANESYVQGTVPNDLTVGHFATDDSDVQHSLEIADRSVPTTFAFEAVKEYSTLKN